MKYLIAIIVLLYATGCTGLIFSDKHYLIYHNGELSCRANRCCYPWKKPLMICTEANNENQSITLEYRY